MPKFNSKLYVSFLNFSFHQILRLPNFNMVFQFFKSKLFSCLPKVDHVMTVLQSAYQLSKREGRFTLRPLLVQGSGGTSSLRKLQVFTSCSFSSFPFLFFLPFSLHSSFPFFCSFCSFTSSSFLFSYFSSSSFSSSTSSSPPSTSSPSSTSSFKYFFCFAFSAIITTAMSFHMETILKRIQGKTT